MGCIEILIITNSVQPHEDLHRDEMMCEKALCEERLLHSCYCVTKDYSVHVVDAKKDSCVHVVCEKKDYWVHVIM